MRAVSRWTGRREILSAACTALSASLRQRCESGISLLRCQSVSHSPDKMLRLSTPQFYQACSLVGM